MFPTAGFLRGTRVPAFILCFALSLSLTTACDDIDDGESNEALEADGADTIDRDTSEDGSSAEPDTGLPATCLDNTLNGDETGIDCGGPTCAPCAIGEPCRLDRDCPGTACDNGECAAPRCGDGIVQGIELCDDGNTDDTDGCTSACTTPTCGDGIVQAGELCDDGNRLNTDSCLSSCVPASCGDGFILLGVETCDDGNTDDDDACPTSCQPATCGDGFVRTGFENCDDGNRVDGDECTNACTVATCGDGVVGPGEGCDDGNLNNNDACTSLCQVAFCGDGLIRAGVEQCDDGNSLDDDTCPSTCVLPDCGDGFVGPNEDCDDGNDDDSDACLSNCRFAVCGDGILQEGVEQCDDGNETDDDACANSCRVATCFDGIKNGNETDVDCGGGACDACQDGQACTTPLDCETGFCSYASVCGPPQSCLDHRIAGSTQTGIYEIAPGDSAPLVPVLCDMTTDGGGWTLVASSRTTPLKDQAAEYSTSLTTTAPGGPNPGVWRGMRPVVADSLADMRFTCKQINNAPDMTVDLSFYEVPWYAEITTGIDAESCFSEGDGLGWDGPIARRNNVTGEFLDAIVPRLDREGCSGEFMEGEDVCGDENDFTVDFNGRGKDCGESDGTDWGEDDGQLKCGSGALGGGTWHIWVREQACGDGARNRDETDVDCGGTSCRPCLDGGICLVDTDCASGACVGGLCQPASCNNDVLDGDETDIDCGGACDACAAGASCVQATDCRSGDCVSGVCEESTL